MTGSVLQLKSNRLRADMKDQRERKVTIRGYRSEDHKETCQVFSDGIMENWLPAYKRYLTFKSPTSSLIQLVQISVLYHHLSSVPVFLAVEFVIQAIIMFSIFHHYGGYARYSN